jgi:uncharacterized RDD family membrane protein YckC
MENYAGFWKRLVAIIIDGLILGVAQVFIFVPILGALGFGLFESGADYSNPEEAVGMMAGVMAAMGAAYILSYILQVLYFTFMESSKFQASLGKMALGIIVTDMNGGKLDFSKALVRNLCRLLSNFTMLIGYIIAAFTAKKQALHDIIAGTLVVNKK